MHNISHTEGSVLQTFENSVISTSKVISKEMSKVISISKVISKVIRAYFSPYINAANA